MNESVIPAPVQSIARDVPRASAIGAERAGCARQHAGARLGAGGVADEAIST